MENLSILLVEDVAINRYIVVQYLQSQLDVQIDEAGNGLEAVEKVKTKDYDIILMDIRMPEMDGIEAATVIRSSADPKLQKIPILALTADTARDFMNDQENIFIDVVTKPFNPNELYTKVLKYTSTPRSDISRQEEAPPMEKTLKEVSRFQQVENSFQGNTSSILNFYNMAEKTLMRYKENYRKAVDRLDAVALGDINHKARVTLKVLGLEKTFQVRLEEGETLVERKAAEKEMHEFLKDMMQQFDEVTEAIRTRRDHITQQGL